MDKNNKSAGWAIFAVTAAAALAATGYWAYKNKDKLKEVEKKVNKFKHDLESWKQEKQEVFSNWQEELEEFAEDLSNKYKNNPEEAKQYLGKALRTKINGAKKAFSNIKASASQQSRSLAEESTAKARKDVKMLLSTSAKQSGSNVAKNVVNAVKDVKDSAFGLNSRQESIYKIVKNSQKATMQEFADKIGAVTTRTLRRDLTKLQKLGLIEQIGKTKDSYYLIKK